MPDATPLSSVKTVGHEPSKDEYEDWEVGIDQETDADLDNWVGSLLEPAPRPKPAPEPRVVAEKVRAPAGEDVEDEEPGPKGKSYDASFHFRSLTSYADLDPRAPILYNPDVPLSKRIFLTGGCELTYISRKLESFGHQTYSTFVNKVGGDPVGEFLGCGGSHAVEFNADVVVMSATQLLKPVLRRVDPRSRKPGDYTFEDQDQELDALLASMSQAIAKCREVLPKAKIVLMTNPYYSDRILPFYEEATNADTFTIRDLHLKYALGLSMLARTHGCIMVDIDDVASGFGKADAWRRPNFRLLEPYGGHPTIGLIANALQGILHATYATEKKIKALVVDVDNTLWDGVLIEDGPDHVAKTVRVKAIQELQRLAARGLPIALCSKNNSDAIDHITNATNFAKGFMGCVVAHRINWEPKSRNIAEIAQELNIGLDTIAFFDDSAFERAEVAATLPDVRIFTDQDLYQVSRYAPFIPSDPLSDDAKQRVRLYKAEAGRKIDAAAFAGTYEDFLVASKFQLELGRAKRGDISRVAELIGRTNQQNVTLRRTSLESVQAMITAESHDVWCCTVSDNRDEYGMIGIVIASREPEHFNLTEVAFSCRAMSKGIEKAFLQKICSAYVDQGSAVVIDVQETDKNKGMIEILQKVGFAPSDGQYRLSNETLQRDYDRWINWVG